MDRQLAADDKEEVVGLVVLVPDERALDLDDLKLVVVDEPDDARLVRLPEQRQLFRKVDLLVYVGRSGSRSPLERLGSGAGDRSVARRRTRPVNARPCFGEHVQL